MTLTEQIAALRQVGYTIGGLEMNGTQLQPVLIIQALLIRDVVRTLEQLAALGPRIIEWDVDDRDGLSTRCNVCRNWKRTGHAADCWLRDLLALIQGETT